MATFYENAGICCMPSRRRSVFLWLDYNVLKVSSGIHSRHPHHHYRTGNHRRHPRHHRRLRPCRPHQSDQIIRRYQSLLWPPQTTGWSTLLMFSATRGRNSDFALPPRSEFRLHYFARKRSVSDLVLARSLTESPCRQSCRQRRIAPLNPALTTGLLHSILRWQQDCPPSILRWQQDCPLQSCGWDAVNPASLPDLPPGFPASNLGSNAKGRMGKIKLFPTMHTRFRPLRQPESERSCLWRRCPVLVLAWAVSIASARLYKKGGEGEGGSETL